MDESEFSSHFSVVSKVEERGLTLGIALEPLGLGANGVDAL